IKAEHRARLAAAFNELADACWEAGFLFSRDFYRKLGEQFAKPRANVKGMTRVSEEDYQARRIPEGLPANATIRDMEAARERAREPEQVAREPEPQAAESQAKPRVRIKANSWNEVAA